LLPSAFLLGVLLFLVTHGREDPGFGAYPFFESFAAGSRLASTPEARFVEQALVFFLPLYLVALLFVLCVALAEGGLFGRRKTRRSSAYGRSFRGTFVVFFLISGAAVVLLGDRLASRYAPGALVAPVLVALAPFLAPVLALVPAALVALPVSFLRRAHAT
jgi:hypothetical protein